MQHIQTSTNYCREKWRGAHRKTSLPKGLCARATFFRGALCYVCGSPLRGRDADEVELPEHLVVRRHLSLPLQRLDLHLALVIRCRREGLITAGCFRARGGPNAHKTGRGGRRERGSTTRDKSPARQGENGEGTAEVASAGRPTGSVGTRDVPCIILSTQQLFHADTCSSRRGRGQSDR